MTRLAIGVAVAAYVAGIAMYGYGRALAEHRTDLGALRRPSEAGWLWEFFMFDRRRYDAVGRKKVFILYILALIHVTLLYAWLHLVWVGK